jgi:hypothetical protein
MKTYQQDATGAVSSASPAIGPQPAGPAEPGGAGQWFTAVYFAACTATYVLALAINWAGNTTNLWPSPWRPPTTDRAWKTRRLETLVRSGEPPKLLVLGSSRAQQLHPLYLEALTGQQAFNYAVSSGNIVDCLAQLRYAIRIGARPDVLVLTVDEQMLTVPIRARQLHLAGHGGLFAEVPVWEELKIFAELIQNVNLSTTTRSLTALFGPAPPGDPQVLQIGEETYLENGYFIFPGTLARSRGTYDLKGTIQRFVEYAEQQAHLPTPHREPTVFDPRLVGHLRRLLALAGQQRIAVRVLITPEHPSARDTALGTCRQALHGELCRLLTSECQRPNCAYFDASALASFQGDPDEFWDWIHQTPVNMRRMTNALFGVDPGRVVRPLPDDAETLCRLSGTSQALRR